VLNRFDTLADWESVVIHKRWQESRRLKVEHCWVQGFQRLYMPGSENPSRVVDEGCVRKGGAIAIVYRIVPLSKSGRFERAEPIQPRLA
jgi:hypothetical protein